MFRFGEDAARRLLLKNTLLLQILQVSTYLMTLVIVLYETRVLGPEVYGVLGVATAITAWFQMVIDFGFQLSATQEVAAHRDERGKLDQILTAVTIGKLCLAALSASVLLTLCRLIPAWREKTGLYFLFFLSAVSLSLIPDYIYRGKEQMAPIVIRAVTIRAAFTMAIFFVLKKPEDLYVIPVLNIIGNSTALAAAYADLRRRFGVRFVPVSAGEVGGCLKRSLLFFYSNLAAAAYTSLNTVILDLTGAGAATGFYTCADKLIVTGKTLLSPISDSLYPYMVHRRDFRLVKKLLLITTPLTALFCAGCFLWAEKLCVLLFGTGYGPAGQVLRAMLPIGVMALPNYILGFPTLTAMGLSRYANYSVAFGSVIHICNLLILYFSGNINMVALGALASVAEAAILLFRVIVIWRHRDGLRPEGKMNEE